MPKSRTYASHGDACAASHAMELLGDRWTYPVLRELMLSPKRFAELEGAVRGITPAVLTARLRHLEASGLINRLTLPAPARATVYELTDWAKELQPLLEPLARWALRSPVRDVSGCGLTPDAIIQSMLTMAPKREMHPPLEMELRLADGRTTRDSDPYVYRLNWGTRLSIERGSSEAPQATITGDSSEWAAILYENARLDVMRVTGDRMLVERLVAAFDGVIDDAMSPATAPSQPARAT